MSDDNEPVMEPRVKEVFDRGNESRDRGLVIKEEVRRFVAILVERYEGSERMIRRQLEAAADELLAKKEEEKRKAYTRGRNGRPKIKR